jgi:hypothetical protein
MRFNYISIECKELPNRIKNEKHCRKSFKSFDKKLFLFNIFKFLFEIQIFKELKKRKKLK